MVDKRRQETNHSIHCLSFELEVIIGLGDTQITIVLQTETFFNALNCED